MTWFFATTLINITQTNKYTQHTEHRGTNRMTYPYKYILTPPVLCSHQMPGLYSMNNLLISKIYFTEFYNVFAVEQKSLTCRSHISFD